MRVCKLIVLCVYDYTSMLFETASIRAVGLFQSITKHFFLTCWSECVYDYTSVLFETAFMQAVGLLQPITKHFF